METIRGDVQVTGPLRCTGDVTNGDLVEFLWILGPARKNATTCDIRKICLAFDAVLKLHPEAICKRIQCSAVDPKARSKRMAISGKTPNDRSEALREPYALRPAP